MFRMFLYSKIRDVRITGVNLHYEGSITIDEDYLERSGILANEEVHVLNVNTGTRLTTYVIKGERGSGKVELNGPAARLGMVGDNIMILSYAMLSPEEIENHEPTIINIEK
ncbi:aspartate 1-decarboxylase [Chitinispirillales bacterium ANBcel5]|uniref:aspartate 1-decarboxylase n=1 Tax=Cellulosispirillum alkaliphilum TaxID=3039283 RepID=UPI002A56E1CD|nr:aspartate 1-decarboxylase [Chitinispirillales bacterium ANBcel5]